jgi:lipopolysaccharide/colanic/teichoic acid biosynthesis glycosyltransferase
VIPEPVVSRPSVSHRAPRRVPEEPRTEAVRLVPVPLADVDHWAVDDSGIDWDAVLPNWAGTPRWNAWRAAKRGLDVVLSIVAMIVLTPLFVVVAIVIKLDSRGRVLHRVDWVGLRGRRFHGYKFRTMVPGAEQREAELREFNEMSGPAFKMRHDPRVTRVGRFLRRWSIDELPQLWSVLQGDMSLVGPRPPRLHEYEAFAPWQRQKAAVVPGITCTWQVSGRNMISSVDDWARMDIEYIRGWSFLLDLKILVATIPAVLSGRGAH